MTVNVEQAGLTLNELIEKTGQGEKVVITRDQKPVAELIAVAADGPRPVFGSCQGMLTVLSEDDEHLKDFSRHMK